MVIAQQFIQGAAFNMLKNLKYYLKRGKDTAVQIIKIEALVASIENTKAIDELMGIEGNIRLSYYSAFSEIINDFEMNNRTKQPPNNEVNAMISFVNMICYTACLDQIYHTQLNPTISFLHEPGFRRYSLALDLAEVFKPLLADRLIFSLLNKKMIQSGHFDLEVNSCLLKESGRKVVMRAWDEKLNETIKHRTLDQSISYKRLIRLECYKLVKHIMEIQDYKPFKTWW